MAEMDILMEGEITDIVTNLNAAEATYVACNSPGIPWWSWVAAELEFYRGRTENSPVAFGNDPGTAKNCMAALADPVNKMHGKMDTSRWAFVYFAFVQRNTDAVGTLQALRRLADVHMMDDDETALHLFQLSLKGGTKKEIKIMLRRGDPIEAKRMWGAAHPLFVRLSRRKDAASIAERLKNLSQRANSDSLFAIPDSGSVVVKLSDSAMETSLEKLGNLFAPTSSPSLRVEGVATSTHEQVFRSRLKLLRSAKVFISSNRQKSTSKECKKVMVTTKNFASTPEQYGYFLKDFARSLVAYSTQC
ncbi:hypothetical protein B0H14DRAFT_2605759 [Mycena olivaceomarginata]|nr:hypothetical protein B0H14DRAFT_2605759 [Mycena olivaceomarginata]